MPAALVLGLLFLGGAIYNLCKANPDYPNAIFGLILSGILIGLFFLFRLKEHKDDKLFNWLLDHRATIDQGGMRYEDCFVTRDTKLVYYQMALSFGVVSFKVPSRYYLLDYHSTGAVAFAFSLVSLLLGWWGIPWGPIYTVQALDHNSASKGICTVGEILGPIQTLTVSPWNQPPSENAIISKEK